MNVYRITVTYLDGTPVTFEHLYAAKNFNVAVHHACSIRDNCFIPDSATHAVVDSAEQLGSVALIGANEPFYEADYQAFAEDLVRWVQRSPFAVIRENKN